MALTKMRLNWGVNTPVKIKIDNQAEESYTGSYKDVELQEGEHTVVITIVETNKTITVPLLVPKSISDRIAEMHLFPESEKEELQNQINTLTNEKTTLTNEVTTLNNEKSALQVSLNEKIQEINDASQGYIDILEFSSDRKIIKFNTTDKFKTGWKVYAKSANAETEIQPNTNINNGVAIDALLVKDSSGNLKDTIDMNFTIVVSEPLPDFNSIFNQITENTYIPNNKVLIVFKNNTGRKLYYNKVTRSGLSNDARSSFDDGVEISIDGKDYKEFIVYYDDLNGQYPNVKREFFIPEATGIYLTYDSVHNNFTDLANMAEGISSAVTIDGSYIKAAGIDRCILRWNLDDIFTKYNIPKNGSYSIFAYVEYNKNTDTQYSTLYASFGVNSVKYNGTESEEGNTVAHGTYKIIESVSLSQIFDYEPNKELIFNYGPNDLDAASYAKITEFKFIKIT